jgi:hypothetical protein
MCWLGIGSWEHELLKWKPWCWDLDLSWYHHVKNDGCHRDLISLSNCCLFFFLKESLILTYNFSYSIKPKNTELSLSIVLVINKACFASCHILAQLCGWIGADGRLVCGNRQSKAFKKRCKLLQFGVSFGDDRGQSWSEVTQRAWEQLVKEVWRGWMWIRLTFTTRSGSIAKCPIYPVNLFTRLYMLIFK